MDHSDLVPGSPSVSFHFKEWDLHLITSLLLNYVVGAPCSAIL